MPIKNIIFDWSGVICDDHKTVYETCMKVFGRFDVKAISYDEFKETFELPYENFNRRYHDRPFAEIKSTYDEECRTTPLPEAFPDAKKTLVEIKKLGISIYLFTSMSNKRLKKESDKIGLSSMFNSIRSDVKDKIKEIKSWIEENRIKPADTIYVGDMVHDIRAAKEAGIRSVAVTRGYDSKDKLLAEEPDFLIDELSKLLEIIKSKSGHD
ncbi:HAD family hydrolase [Candidatus Woesearchaeota archaeon]|nr:HAD family hydrolase [Candidatus Woesearchaeota archaeon]